MSSIAVKSVLAGTLVLGLLAACGSDGGDGDRGAGCGTEPAAPDCRSLCDRACARIAPCGIDAASCTTDCYGVYACPGETPGQDASICRSVLTALPALCGDLCEWAGNFGGYARGPRVTCNARAWQSFEMTETNVCATPPCESTWSVLPDGSFTSTKQGKSGTGALTLSDLSALDAIVSNPSFHDGMRSGFNCACSPPDSSVRFTLKTDTDSLSADVSGCVFCTPDGNAPQAAHGIVSGY